MQTAVKVTWSVKQKYRFRFLLSIKCKNASVDIHEQVELEKMSSDEGEEKLSHRVVELKLAEIGKLRFTIEGLFCQKNLTEKELNATYLQDEFKRLWSFPRKVLFFN